MSLNHESEIVGLLNGQTFTDYGTAVTGTNLFSGPIRPASETGIPLKCIFVTATGGFPPEGDNDQVTDITHASVQVMYRGDTHEYANGITAAREIRDFLHDNPPATTGYFSLKVRESYPLYLGRGEDGSHLWSMNFDIIAEETL